VGIEHNNITARDAMSRFSIFISLVGLVDTVFLLMMFATVTSLMEGRMQVPYHDA
jgi:hypothetical protein